MGEDFICYCAAHREELQWRHWDAAAATCADEARGGMGVPPDWIRRIREQDWFESENADLLRWAARVREADILGGFIHRHEGCLLRLVSDYGPGTYYDEMAKLRHGSDSRGAPGGVKPGWVDFRVDGDLAINVIWGQEQLGEPLRPLLAGIPFPGMDDAGDPTAPGPSRLEIERRAAQMSAALSKMDWKVMARSLVLYGPQRTDVVRALRARSPRGLPMGRLTPR